MPHEYTAAQSVDSTWVPPAPVPQVKPGFGKAGQDFIQRDSEKGALTQGPEWGQPTAELVPPELAAGTERSKGQFVPSAPGSQVTPIQRLCESCDSASEKAKEPSRNSPQNPIQTKLTIGAPNDPYEQEADRVARQVVNQIQSPSVAAQPIQRMPMGTDGQPITVMRSGAGEATAASADVEQRIQRSRGQGQPLADSVRGPMEQAFGTDFSGVSIHGDASPEADGLNQDLGARAFTTGQDIFFKRGEYQPGTQGGQALLAHELTHVVQQKGGETGTWREWQSAIPGSLIQREVEVSPVVQERLPLLAEAINKFRELDQQDLTEAEYAQLKGEKLRWMPLLKRFRMAKKTKLKIDLDNSTKGEIATTTLVVKFKGKELDYDTSGKEGAALRRILTQGSSQTEGNALSFEVQVIFKIPTTKQARAAQNHMKKGHYLQAFTHEMTVHAENMLDLIETYWQGSGTELPTVHKEHQLYLEKKVLRYEFLKERIEADEKFKQGFQEQEALDKLALWDILSRIQNSSPKDKKEKTGHTAQDSLSLDDIFKTTASADRNEKANSQPTETTTNPLKPIANRLIELVDPIALTPEDAMVLTQIAYSKNYPMVELPSIIKKLKEEIDPKVLIKTIKEHGDFTD